MQIEFTEPASVELDDAIEYYELHLSGLGKKFFTDVKEILNLIAKYPRLFTQNSEHTRKAV